MSIRLVFHTAKRVLTQLRHDWRSLVLVLFVPTFLIVILNLVFDGKHQVFNGVAPLLVGLIPFTIMFIITSVAMLRERTSGTLERLLVSPQTKLELLSGYGVAFALLALIQSTIASLVTLYLLDVTIAGNLHSLLVVAVLSGLSGMALGLFLSAFARNEFQAVQFMPAFVLPQFLMCGLFIPREQMATPLQYLSDAMPLSYIVDAMRLVQTQASWTSNLSADLAIIAGFTLVSLMLGAISLRAD